MNKLRLCILGETGIEQIKMYKSLKLIEKDYPHIPYHNLREIYLYSTKKKMRKLHGYNSKLYEMFRIFDDDEIQL